MKKTILFLTVSMLMINCSSDDTNNGTNDTFEIQLQPSNSSVVVDQAFSVTVNADEDIKQLWGFSG